MKYDLYVEFPNVLMFFFFSWQVTVVLTAKMKGLTVRTTLVQKELCVRMNLVLIITRVFVDLVILGLTVMSL